MSPPDAAELYLDLLKRSLTRTLFDEELEPVRPRRGGIGAAIGRPVLLALARRDLRLARVVRPGDRAEGRDWPAGAETMIGLRRLDSLQACVRDVVRGDVPGDLIECGVWRGGASILMRAALAAYGDESRTVWVADSFRGLPPPDEDRYPADAGDRHWRQPALAVSMDEVRENFRRYGLLDDRVAFLPGWFRDTLPSAPIERLALLRVDADMYGSTTEALEALYPRLSPGGFAIVDDYGAVAACRAAVDDFRARHGVGEPLERIDWTGVLWRRADGG